MKRFALIALILLVIVFVAFPAFAQEATPEPTAETTEVTEDVVAADGGNTDVAAVEAEPESAQGAALAVILIGGAAVASVVGFVMLRDGLLGKRK